MPTETVYGLAGNAYKENIIKKIFKIKKRPKCKPIIIHDHSIESIKKYVKEFPEKALKLAKHFWPGPLTILLKKKSIIPDVITGGLPYIGVRIPNHKKVLKILSNLDFPVTMTSANISGSISPTTAEHVKKNIGNKISYILNGNKCEIGIESTIIGISKNKIPKIYRIGSIKAEEIKKIIGSVKIIKEKKKLTDNYSIKTPFIIGNIRELIKKNRKRKIGIFSFNKKYKNIKNQKMLSKKSNLNEAAKNFFYNLKELDEVKNDIIIASYVPNIGIGKIINDKIKRLKSRKI